MRLNEPVVRCERRGASRGAARQRPAGQRMCANERAPGEWSGQTRPAWPGNAIASRSASGTARCRPSARHGWSPLPVTPSPGTSPPVRSGSIPSKNSHRARRQPRAVGRRPGRVVGAVWPGRRGRRHRGLRAPRRGPVRAADCRRRSGGSISTSTSRSPATTWRSRTRPSSTLTPARMSYPDDVVRGAWSGISALAPRYTTGEWPFDGWMGAVSRCRGRRATRRFGA